MAPYTRGGIPRHMTGTTAVTTSEKWQVPEGVANYVWFKNTGTGNILLSFTSADSVAGRGITLAPGTAWEGPAEVGALYTYSTLAQTFEAVAFLRRG